MSVSSFIPKVWSARLNHGMEKAQIVCRLCNRYWEGDISSYGDTVHIGSLSDVTIRQYTPGVDISDPETLSGTDTVLTIDHGEYFNFVLNDVDRAQARVDIMDAAVENAAYKLMEDTEQYVLGKIRTEAGLKKSGKVPAKAEGGIYALLIAIKQLMDENNVPRHGRKLIVPASVESQLLLDDRFITGSGAFGNSRLEDGSIARAAGFDIYVSPDLTAEMVAMIPEAVTFAQQITQVEAYRREKGFDDAVKGLSLCGAKVVLPKAVVHYTILADDATDA